MAKTFHLTIAKVGENLYDGEALSATFPGVDGELTVLANHEPFVTLLASGRIRVQPDGADVQEIAVGENGVLEVSSNQATVIL